MHRIDHASATDDNKFTPGDPGEAIPATTVTADIMNAFQEEIASVIEGAEIALDKEDNGQLLAAVQALIAALAIKPGVILDYGGGTIPDGFLPCDGSAVSRTTYAALFEAIGVTWGAGDSETTFNLPNLCGRTTIGDGTGSMLTARTLGQAIGAETHGLTVPEMPLHNHTIATENGAGASSGYVLDTSTTPSTNTTGTTGEGEHHNNMQPSLVVKKMIKT